MSKQLRYRFIAFPVHLDTYGFLNEDEKSVLQCLIRLGKLGWFYGDKKLAKNLGIGVYHLRRAKLRLHLLGLIRIERRGRQNFSYYFQDDIENWKLTESINAKLQVDHEKMGMGHIEFKKEPFKSSNHFSNYFSQQFPKFSLGRKGRSKDETDEFDEIETDGQENPYRLPVRKFKTLIDKIEATHPTKLLSDFFNYKPQIQEVKYGDFKSDDPLEADYYTKLDAMADQLIRDPDEKLKLILKEVQFQVEKGDSFLSISNYLLSVYKNQIKEHKIEGGKNEIQE